MYDRQLVVSTCLQVTFLERPLKVLF